MRRVSFFITKAQIIARTKYSTRRMRWRIKPGEKFLAIEKGQGLKKGQKQRVLSMLECTGVRSEPLDCICEWDERDDTGKVCANEECAREGFPDMSGDEFVAMFCTQAKCDEHDEVFVVTFKYCDKVIP